MLNDGFIICEDTFKENFLKDIEGIHNYTFLSLSELTKKLIFDIKKEGIIKLCFKYKIKPEIAKEYIKYLKYINLFYDDKKLDFLKEIYKFLLDEDMLIFDKEYQNYLRTKPIYIMGYTESKEIDFVLNILKKNNYNYEFIENENKPHIKRQVYEFNDIVDEARFVFSSIKDLLDKGYPIDNIKIANYSNDYDFIFHRLEGYYKIPINFEADKNILSTNIAKYLISLLDNSDSYYDVIDKLKEKYSSSVYLKRIINLINSYHLYNYQPKDTKEIVIMELKQIKYDKKTYENGISFVDLGSPSIKEDDTVFVLSFNQNYIPRIYLDQGFLSDDILSKLNLDTSVDKTILEEKTVVHNLNLDINYIISYKLNSPFNSYLPSALIKKLGYSITRFDNSFGKSESEDKIIIGDILDNYYKYGFINEKDTDKIYDIKYLKYDNKFKGITKDNLIKYLPETINLSYSTMSNYTKCAFKYLMSSILHLDEFEEGIAAYIGTYSHKILEEHYKNDDFELNKKKAIAEVLEKKKASNYNIDTPLTSKENFFLNQMDHILKAVIEFNTKHEKLITDVKTEEKFSMEYDNGKLVFKGFIDKLLIENNKYFTIIDYKTGPDVASDENVEYGFNLQLPIYLFMVKKSKDYNNPIITGYFLQKIGPLDYPDFILRGFSNSDDEVLKHLDGFVNDSDYVSGLKRKNDGTLYSTAKVKSEKEMDDLTNLVEKIMLDRYSKIREGKFDINPKVSKNKNLSCEYCSFKDVCFVREEDKVKLDEAGGEENVD